MHRVVVDGSSSDLMAINAGVPQGSVLSPTLFLLHINDLLKPGIFGYADDSTVTVRYMSSPRASGDETLVLREALVERVNLALSEVSDWGDTNLTELDSEGVSNVASAKQGGPPAPSKILLYSKRVTLTSTEYQAKLRTITFAITNSLWIYPHHLSIQIMSRGLSDDEDNGAG
ncbi:jg6477 [Pararge aegeria aegeria]|uniref:Jg6477 protein n=1 Tax=Pararge aegeria aegeria TaxID=348720 RepID=A0A8S4SPY1_9NEOP|nr:jg6477 [Pararge aegeria aegeria]